MLYRSLSGITISLLLMSSFALQAADIASLKQQALVEGLHHKEQWRDLLHFDGSESYVDDSAFFFSDDGKYNPEAELLATLEALTTVADGFCRFPARSHWLTQQLPGLSALIQTAECDEYSLWRSKVNAHSVTLVLASSYLNSPSSMYGHTFLRFDPEKRGAGVDLTSYAVNFGALVDTSDGGMFYAFKGLVGGYPGYFSDGPYYEKVQEYSRLDNRDVWEYQLNLTPAEVDFMLMHLWELKDINFDYYFFDENCSFRLLELLEVARPSVNLVEDFPAYAIPIDTVRSVQREQMIADIVYRPSNKTKLSHNIRQLSAAEQDIVLAMVNGDQGIILPAYQTLASERQYVVAEVAYQYLRFKMNRKARDSRNASLSFELLKEMKRLAAEAPDVPPINVPARPEQGHETAVVALMAGVEEEAEFVQLELRGSYHDLLDNLYAYSQSISLNIGKLAVRVREHDGAQLQYLDLIEITSVSERDDFFKPISWRVKAGLERQWTAGEDELVSHISGGGGWTHTVWGDLKSFAFIYGRLEYNGEKDSELDIAAGADIGLLFQHQKSSFMLEALQYRFTDGEERRQVRAGYQLPIGVNHGLRFEFSRNLLDDVDINESSLSYRYTF